MRSPLVLSIQIAGVRSPYLDPPPMPLPPIVMWKICVRALLIVFALKSKETLHSFFRLGRVVRRLLFVISVSSAREKIVLHVPAKDVKESCLTFIMSTGCPYSLKSLLEFNLNDRICRGYKICPLIMIVGKIKYGRPSGNWVIFWKQLFSETPCISFNLTDSLLLGEELWK